MMEYRPIAAAEVPRWREFQEYSFQITPAEFDPWMAQKFRIAHTRSLFDEQGRMKSTCALWPFQLHWEGVRLPMGGIASVASLPENRRSGLVGQLLGRLVQEMKEREMPLSALFPFQQAFYRRFGWEVASAWVEHTIPLALLHPGEGAGSVQRLLPGEGDWRILSRVYDRWAQVRRGYMVRPDEFHWRNWVYQPWPKSQFHTAIFAPAGDAVPEGYLLYKLDRDDHGKSFLQLQELVCLTPQAWRSLWRFVANHDSQAESVRVRTSRTYPIWELVSNTRPVQSTLKAGWMLRLVDFQRALEARPWPGDVTGAVTVSVSDSLAPWNAGTWRVEWESGHARVTPAPGAVPVLSADIQTWAQLYAGVVSPARAAFTGGLCAADSEALQRFARALAGEPMAFFEHF